MPTSNVSVRYRPVRIGFVVRKGDIDDLVAVAGINTLLWGGIRNPVLPVSSDLAIAEGIANLFAVDVLSPVARTIEIERFLEKHPFLRDPGHYAEDVFYEDWQSKKNILGYLDSYNLVRYEWDKELKHKPGKFRSDCVMLRWDETDALRRLLAISFGYFPKDYNLRDDYEESFLKGMRARKFMIDPNVPVAAKVAKWISPLIFTNSQLHPFVHTRHYDRDGIYVGDDGDFEDLCIFWNLRASGASVVFLSINHAPRLDAFVKAHLDSLDSRPSRKPEMDESLTVYYRLEDDDRLSKLIADFKTVKPLLRTRCTDSLSALATLEPDDYYFSWDNTLAVTDTVHDHPKVSVNLPDKTFCSGSKDHAAEQQLAVSLRAMSDISYPGHTLNPPFLRELNEFYSREIAFDPWELRVERDGIGCLITAVESTLSLFPIGHYPLLVRLFELVGTTASPSQAGLLTTRVVEQLGGLENARVLKIGGVRKLLQKLGATDTVSRGQATKTIWDDGRFKKHEGLYIEPRDSAKLSTSAVMDFLLSKDIFRAGLEFECDHCKLYDWFSLREISDFWTCRYCGHENRTSLHLKDRGDWRFRKSGLFARTTTKRGQYRMC
jgi:hypothetical protein